MLKRSLDIVLSLAGLILVAPFMLLIALLIRLDSSGPVFFRQVRVGKDAKNFRVLKFRTMVENAENIGPRLTEPDDPRITQMGHILRWTKVDELPQLVNVLRGEMSLVGPRPELPSIVATYTEKQHSILRVRPGIVGPSQIKGRHELDQYPDRVDVEKFYMERILPQKLQVDMDYVRNPRVLNDLKWLLEGIWVTISGSFKIHYVFMGKRRLLFFGLDMLLTVSATIASFYLRYEGILSNDVMATLLWTCPIILAVRIPFYVYQGLYQTLWQYLGLHDILAVVRAVAYSTLFLVLVYMAIGFRQYTRSIIFLDAFLVMVFLISTRVVFKLALDRVAKGLVRLPQRNALIVGAGDTGEVLVRELIRRPELGIRPVAFVDDDEKKQGMKIHGVKVIGKCYDIKRIVAVKKVKEVIIAVSSVTDTGIQALFADCRKAGVACRIAPRIKQLVTDRALPFRIRDVSVEDLLGRQPIEADFNKVQQLLNGKTVMVTGGAGSIGSELCRQIIEYGPRKLLIVDRSENDLFELDHEFRGRQKGKNWSCHLLDVQSKDDLQRLFKKHTPQIVFHAAAYKHVPLMEENLKYAIRCNIFGTKNLADLSCEYGADRFVLISTDKVVNPTSVMGASKRVAELYMASRARKSPSKLMAVRFGNVLSSRGSVVPLFLKQIELGGPITITDPEVRRYFMSISEAVLLILQSAVLGIGGEIFRLEMGKPMRILDLAKTLIRFSGLQEGQIPIEITGMRPGEKMYEELVGAQECEEPTENDKIRMIRSSMPDDMVLEQGIAKLGELVRDGDEASCLDQMRQLVPEYRLRDRDDSEDRHAA